MTKLFCALQAIDVENEIVINPGDHESLTVEGPADVLDRIETGVQGDELHIRLGGWTDKIRAALAQLRSRPEVAAAVHNGRLSIDLRADLDVPSRVSLPPSNGVQVDEVRRGKASLEEAFPTLTEEEKRCRTFSR